MLRKKGGRKNTDKPPVPTLHSTRLVSLRPDGKGAANLSVIPIDITTANSPKKFHHTAIYLNCSIFLLRKIFSHRGCFNCSNNQFHAKQKKG
ncbi:hypothetical protein DWUX_2713 [Desulfovibrio diazotrophicus]|nr:hypothetical protein DWUX_2713 [Desulfovibrio diazotrophicus]